MRTDQADQTPEGVQVALRDMRLLIHLRGVLSYPIHRFCFGSKALNSALVTRVVSDHHVPPGPLVIWELLNDWFLVGISGRWLPDRWSAYKLVSALKVVTPPLTPNRDY